MSDEDLKQYVPMIDAILSASDLENVTVKRIRGAVECLFAVDLIPRKSDISKLIKERYYLLAEQKEKEKLEASQKHESDGSKKKKSAKAEKTEAIEEDNKKMALRLHAQSNKRKLAKPKASKVTKEKPAKKQKQRKNIEDHPFMRPLKVSPELCNFLHLKQGSTMARTEVVKKVWEHIRETGLQNPEDKREIFCDDAMRPIFGDKTTIFAMNKSLAKHLTKFDAAESPKD